MVQPENLQVSPLPPISTPVWLMRGSVVESVPLQESAVMATGRAGAARRAVYRSVSATDGQGSEVSGTFFIPPGRPPHGGWPVVSLAHGTTGLTNECGPSLYDDLMGYASTVTGMLTEGYAVAFTDYQGLGHSGVHPYLEPRTAAFNVIDAVRAIRHVFPGISTEWMAIGESQGGQASWAANEYASDYGAELDIRGSVALMPAADISELAVRSTDGSLTDGQVALMPMIIEGLDRIDPTIVASDYLRGPAFQYQRTLTSCVPEVEKAPLYAQLDRHQVRPSDLLSTARLRDLLHRLALPQRPLSAPMLVVNGGADELIDPNWVSDAVSRACRFGGDVTHIELAHRGHNDVGLGEFEMQWIHERFAGVLTASPCQ